MVVFSEGGSQALLTGPKSLMTPGATIAEFPVPSIFVWLAVDAKVLAKHVAASSDVTRLLGGVGEQQALVAMGTCLKHKERS